MRKFLLPALMVLFTACTVHVRPGPRPMDSDEAVRRGYDFCATHGWACQLQNVGPAGDLWRMNFGAEGHGTRGILHLEFNAFSRALVREDHPRPPPPPPRPMAEDEAVRRGNDYCRSRGFACQLVDVDFYNNVIWRLNFNARGPYSSGRLHLEFNGLNRNLVRADEPRPPAPQGPPRPMDSNEAARRGNDFCRSRNYQCQLIDADFAGGHIWRLNYQVSGASQGRVHLEFDAYSRAMTSVNEDIRSD